MVRSLAGCEICAVASKDGEKAARFVAEHAPGTRTFAGYEALLSACRPDAVYIATTPDSHAGLTKLCLRAGVPVLCEKAMFATGAEAAETFAMSRETGVFVWKLSGAGSCPHPIDLLPIYSKRNYSSSG